MAYNIKKKTNNGYFSKEIQRNGENFLDYKNPRNLEGDSIRLFRDLANDRVNIEQHGHYLLQPQFLEALIQASYSKLVLHDISYNSINFYMNNLVQNNIQPDVNMPSVLEYHRRRCEAYSVIHNALLYLKSSKDLNYLYVLKNNISRYRNDL